LLVVAAAVVVAPFVARGLVAVTGRIPPLDDLTGGQALDVAEVQSLRPWLLAGGIIAFVAMGVAVIPYARRGILSLRALASRPGQKSVWQRFNLDLFAIALSLVVLFQLSQRGFINTSGDEVTLDPVAIIFPVLLLFTGALVLLRVFPFLLKFVGWAMTKSRSMSMALPGWHLGRNPVPYGRLALLVWVTTGLGAFALTYAATLQGSFDDRAAYAAGADVRVVGPNAGYLQEAEGELATPVLRTSGGPRQSGGRQAETLAVRPDEFSRVVAWRDDFGAATPEEIFSPLRPDGVAPDIGVEVPGSAVALAMDGIVVPEPWANQPVPDDDTSGYRFLVRVIDAGSRVWTMAAEADWTDERWVTATVDLGSTLDSDISAGPEAPFTIHSWWVERSERTANFVVDGSTLLVADLRAVDGDGSETPLDLSEMTAINGMGWQPGTAADVAARTYYSEIPEGETVGEADITASPRYREGDATSVILPQRTRGNPAVPQLRRLPGELRVLLDREAAAIAGLSIGDLSSYGIAGQILNGELAGFVDRVPTMTDRRLSGRMIVDLDPLNAWLNGAANWSLVGGPSRLDAPQELWVATDSVDASVRRLAAQDENTEVLTIRGSAASFSSRPVQVGLVAILFVGAATGVILALAGVTGYVLLAVTRRAREMGVLRALGFGRSGVGITFALEQVVVIGLGAFIGVAGGIALVRIMIPFLQLGETAEVVEPPIALTVPWSLLLGYVAIVGAMLVLSVLWATRRVSVRRMSEVLREVER
jgi:FtsX-like permease family